MNCAVIVDNRPGPKIDKVIAQHMQYLEGWQVKAVNNIPISNSHDYNSILTSVDFWEPLCEFDRVLIFQHDSFILRDGIHEFLEYDYVGSPWLSSAPWARTDRRGGNGGFSLRNPRKCLELIQVFPYTQSQGNEDVYYVHNLEKVGANIAPHKVCKKFAVETDFQLNTFGYHNIDNYLTQSQCHQIRNQYLVSLEHD